MSQPATSVRTQGVLTSTILTQVTVDFLSFLGNKHGWVRREQVLDWFAAKGLFPHVANEQILPSLVRDKRVVSATLPSDSGEAVFFALPQYGQEPPVAAVNAEKLDLDELRLKLMEHVEHLQGRNKVGPRKASLMQWFKERGIPAPVADQVFQAALANKDIVEWFDPQEKVNRYQLPRTLVETRVPEPPRPPPPPPGSDGAGSHASTPHPVLTPHPSPIDPRALLATVHPVNLARLFQIAQEMSTSQTLLQNEKDAFEGALDEARRQFEEREKALRRVHDARCRGLEDRLASMNEVYQKLLSSRDPVELPPGLLASPQANLAVVPSPYVTSPQTASPPLKVSDAEAPAPRPRAKASPTQPSPPPPPHPTAETLAPPPASSKPTLTIVPTPLPEPRPEDIARLPTYDAAPRYGEGEPRVLEILDTVGSLTAKQVADLGKMLPPSAERCLQNLLHRGATERLTDKKPHVWRITTAGKKLLAEGVPAPSPATPEEIEQYKRAILDALRAEGELSTKQVALAIGKATDLARFYLKKLEDEGKVKHRGIDGTTVQVWSLVAKKKK